MDADTFDGLLRSFATAATRRGALRALAGGALGVGTIRAEAAGASTKCGTFGVKCDKRRVNACCGVGDCLGGRCQCRGEDFIVNGGCFAQATCELNAVTCSSRCGNARGRGGLDGCFCGTTVENSALCFRNGPLCERTCRSNDDCPIGQACFKSDCAGGAGTCFEPCPGKHLVV
ncbi:MAG TPA: hypothetical protein VFQ80_03255 [Thermomicrobiales bacterium]|jgi:hypothetical protein|nr:hypothetical protein [Thermomicrobiales bacterium]